MIIKGKAKHSRSFSPFWWIGLIVLSICGYPLYKNYTVRHQPSIAGVIICDAEQVSDGKFINGSYTFGNGKLQSNEQSYGGKYSCKVDAEHLYGMSLKLDNPPTNTKYKISVRRWTANVENSALAVKANPISAGFTQTTNAIEKDQNGWELMEVELVLSDTSTVKSLTIFPYFLSNRGQAYFDDLKIEMIPIASLDAIDADELHLYLDDKAVKKINSKREEALDKGILQASDDDWVKAKLTENNTITHDIKARLKGDWTDHLLGDYWSYRIKMSSDQSWNRLQTFSLQDPNTRGYLLEWIYHKALEKVDVITPRYGFVKFRKNDQRTVLYAYEEHFEKQIAEFKSRREGVIMKLSDEYLWNQRVRNRGMEIPDIYENAVHNSDILTFGESKTFKNPKLEEQFLRAQDLINAFKERKNTPGEIFDLQLMAKYLAITDIFNANHGIIWHNLRFYYNPITRKLEPIGFDGFTEEGAYKMYNSLFFGEFKSSDEGNEWSAFYQYLYRDPDFNKYYVPALNIYSEDIFINEVLNENEQDISNYEALIQMYAVPGYQLDKNEIRTRAKRIHDNIQLMNNASLKAFRAKDNEVISVSNYHSLPIEIIGSGVNETYNESQTQSLFIKSNGRVSPPTYTDLSDIPSSHNFIYYRLYGTDGKVYYSNIKRWQNPNPLVVRYSEKMELKIPLSKGTYDVIDQEITIYAGDHTIEKPIIIPRGYTLRIVEGAHLDFINKSYLVTYGAVQIIGSETSPITIGSSDKTSQGIAILQAHSLSHVSYTSFTDLNTLEENEWQLTGAVTFYESDVNMNHVTISHNLCEDALNIVRSKFIIDALNINHTYADAFDSDFCTGLLTNSYFHHTGNDAVDYSGSFVNLENLRLIDIGDKGISAGEEATLNLSNITINNAVIGIASKDLSTVNATNISMTDCNQGFVAYQKKPEFGGGKIIVNSYKADNVKSLTQADATSTIQLPN